MNALRRASVLFIVLGVLLAGLAILAPHIGLGSKEDFLGYSLFKITRLSAALTGFSCVAISGIVFGLSFIQKLFWIKLMEFFSKFVSVFFRTLCGAHLKLRKSITPSNIFLVLIAVSAVLGTAKIFDIALLHFTKPTWHEAESQERTLRTYNLYPYTGFHLQPNFHHTGPMPWALYYYDEYDYQSGDHGFFVDIDLESPPEKQSNEFRIIWTGGSGAQGWGAKTNEDMLYRVLEKQLDALFSGENIDIRIINLASGGSVTYQNFIALNRWAHALKPDMIISYSGANDITVPESTRSNVYSQNFFDLRGYMATSFYSESPPYLKVLGEWFPGLTNRTPLGAVLRFLSVPQLTERHRIEYNQSFGQENLPSMYDGKISQSVILDKISIPEYVHALKSIRRDFPQLPIMLVRQVIDWRSMNSVLKMEADYDKFWRASTETLINESNGSWKFIDLQQHWIDSGYFGPDYRMGYVHFDNDMVLLAAKRLVPEIAAIIQERRSLR